MDNDYNKYLFGKDFTAKTLPNRVQFDSLYWILLSPEIQLDRMAKLTISLLEKNDEWAEERMRVRRNNRKFVRPKKMVRLNKMILKW